MAFILNLKFHKTKLIFMLQVIILMLGIILGKGREVNQYAAMLVSCIFFITSCYLWLKNRSVYSKYISRGMFFCFLGDLILAKFIPIGIAFGGSAFAIAHILFIIAYVKTIKEKNGSVFNSGFYISAAIYYIVLISLWSLKFKDMQSAGILKFGSLVYGICITTMAAMAVSLYKNQKQYLKVAIGAVFFMFSDSFVITSQTTTIAYSSIIIWTTYIIGLYGIIYHNSIKIFDK